MASDFHPSFFLFIAFFSSFFLLLYNNVLLLLFFYFSLFLLTLMSLVSKYIVIIILMNDKVLFFIAGGVIVVVVDSLHLYVMCYGHFVIENDVLLCFYYSLESVICLEICVQIFIFMKLQLILICLSRKQLTVSKNKICNPHVEVVNYFNHFYTILKISTFLS